MTRHPIHPLQSFAIIAVCIVILLICYQCRPATYQGKCTVAGLLGRAVGVVIGVVRLIGEGFAS